MIKILLKLNFSIKNLDKTKQKNRNSLTIKRHLSFF